MRRAALLSYEDAVVHAAGILGALLTAYEIHVVIWLWRIMSGADVAARAADRLFPTKFASRMLRVSLAVLVVTWTVFLFGSVSANTLFAGLIAVVGLGVLFVILHPQRVEEREDKEDSPESVQPKEKKFLLSEAQLDCIEKQIRQIVERQKLYLNPQLNRDMLMERLDINRSYLSEVFARRLGPLDQYVNLLRMEHAVRYVAEHPDSKLAEVARCSGFGSMSTFYRIRASYEAGNLSQIDKEPDNRVEDCEPQA